MRRISIRSVMALIILAAIGLAALRNADELWAGTLLLVALALVGLGVMGAVIMRGRERYWWAGFAFFGGAYLALTVGPWLSDTFRPQLGTTQLLDRLRNRMFASSAPPLSADELEALRLKEQILEASLATLKRVTRNPDSEPGASVKTKQLLAIQARLTANKNAAPRTEDFHRAGHSVFALLAALVGGTAAGWLYLRRESEGLP
jgi:hypothetical protein